MQTSSKTAAAKRFGLNMRPRVTLDAIRFHHLTTRIPEHRGRPDIDFAHRVVPHDDQECGRCNQIDRFHRFNPRTQTIAVTDTTTSVGVSF
jgi:hypothetical protein